MTIDNEGALNFGQSIDTAHNSARYLMMRSMIAGGRGQDLFEEFCMEGAKPTAAQIDAAMDKLLASSTRR
jgi:hypothetical protein